MKLKNIVTKSILQIIRTNVLVLSLITTCLIRLYYYSLTITPVDKNFNDSGYISNPVVVDKGQFVYRTSKYDIKSFIPLPVDIGNKIEFKGSKYNSTIYANKITVLKTPDYYKYLFTLKRNLINSVTGTFMEPFSSLILGMLYGIQPNFSPSFIDIMIKSGVIHIVVVSGYNISVLFSFIRRLLISFSLKIRLILSILVGIIYSALTGLEPPILRALLFGIILACAKTYGFKSNTTYILFLVAFIMMILDPSVLYSVSFQLSFLATLGIILINPYLGYYINKKFYLVPTELRDAFVSSMSAQILVFPILLHYFKSFSLISLLTNTLILWMVPIIMTLGFLFSCINLVGLLYLTKFVSIILYLPLLFFVDFITLMSKVPYASLSYSIPIFGVFILYFSEIICYFFIYKFIKIENKGKNVTSITNLK